MKQTILALSALTLCTALAGCQKADAPASGDESAATAPTQATPPVTPEADKIDASTELAKPQDGQNTDKGADKGGDKGKLASVTRFKALGTEPFWNFEIDGSKAKYVTPENQAGTSFDVQRTDSAQGVAFAGPMGKQRVTILITPESCSDGMSDRTHAYTVKAMIDGQTLKGCANPA